MAGRRHPPGVEVYRVGGGPVAVDRRAETGGQGGDRAGTPPGGQGRADRHAVRRAGAAGLPPGPRSGPGAGDRGLFSAAGGALDRRDRGNAAGRAGSRPPGFGLHAVPDARRDRPGPAREDRLRPGQGPRPRARPARPAAQRVPLDTRGRQAADGVVGAGHRRLLRARALREGGCRAAPQGLRPAPAAGVPGQHRRAPGVPTATGLGRGEHRRGPHIRGDRGDPAAADPAPPQGPLPRRRRRGHQGVARLDRRRRR